MFNDSTTCERLFCSTGRGIFIHKTSCVGRYFCNCGTIKCRIGLAAPGMEEAFFGRLSKQRKDVGGQKS